MVFRLLSLLVLLCSCSNFQRSGSFSSPLETPQFRSGGYSSNQEPIYYPLKKFSISRGFSPWGENHFGVDFVAPWGTPVYSAHNGKVIFAGQDFSGYGKLIILEHPDGIASFYAHLSHIEVSPGSLVEAGTKIGRVGKTGRATGVHLHFELKMDKKAVDPMEYLQ